VTPAENRSLGSIGLLVRSLGTFTSGVDGYVLSGLLPQLASSLHVSSSTAGQLATLFALVYAGSAAARVYTCCVPKPGKFGDGLIGRAPKPDEMTEVAGTQA
jgi:MFS family permease